jgi:hypothetical protein
MVQHDSTPLKAGISFSAKLNKQLQELDEGMNALKSPATEFVML